MQKQHSLPELLKNIQSHPESIDFNRVMDVINSHYTFTATAFDNGSVHNPCGQNEGSCKIFAFALLHNLNKEQTLACFGKFYRNDVSHDPQGKSHQNIRQFIHSGMQGIHFEAGNPLST